jgi:hypothetical protein
MPPQFLDLHGLIKTATDKLYYESLVLSSVFGLFGIAWDRVLERDNRYITN